MQQTYRSQRNKINLTTDIKMNFWNKTKNTTPVEEKDVIIESKFKDELRKTKRIRRSLQYLLLLKKFDNVVDYKNLKLLSAFLTKHGKIRS